LSSHPGTLPKRWGFLEIAPQSIVLSALKAGPEGAAVLRLYEAAGQETPAARVRLSAPVAAAEEVNLMEDPGRALTLTDNSLQLDFRPFEIKTIKFRLQPLNATRQK
jgi:alpha-mannosidase